MIGNTRLFQAIYALSTMQGDVRTRVTVAMREIAVLGAHEFNDPNLWKRIENLKISTTKHGPLIINQRTIKDALENTAAKSKNTTYQKYAKEIFSIWIESLSNPQFK